MNLRTRFYFVRQNGTIKVAAVGKSRIRRNKDSADLICFNSSGKIAEIEYNIAAGTIPIGNVDITEINFLNAVGKHVDYNLYAVVVGQKADKVIVVVYKIVGVNVDDQRLTGLNVIAGNSVNGVLQRVCGILGRELNIIQQICSGRRGTMQYALDIRVCIGFGSSANRNTILITATFDLELPAADRKADLISVVEKPFLIVKAQNQLIPRIRIHCKLDIRIGHGRNVTGTYAVYSRTVPYEIRVDNIEAIGVVDGKITLDVRRGERIRNNRKIINGRKLAFKVANLICLLGRNKQVGTFALVRGIRPDIIQPAVGSLTIKIVIAGNCRCRRRQSGGARA